MAEKRNYEYLIFDADHTLLHYTEDERQAFKRMFLDYGLPTDEEMLSACVELSKTVWAQAGMNDVETERVQKSWHTTYRTHVTDIFRILFEKSPCKIDPVTAGKRFLAELLIGVAYMPSAREVLGHFSKKQGGRYGIIVATNGVADMQESRLSPLKAWIDHVFISEKVGYIKPTKEFFLHILNKVGITADKCLMIGDSLSSDMQGAIGVGMDCCWYNFRGAKNEKGVPVTYEIQDLKDLYKLL